MNRLMCSRAGRSCAVHIVNHFMGGAATSLESASTRIPTVKTVYEYVVASTVCIVYRILVHISTGYAPDTVYVDYTYVYRLS